MRLVEFIMGMPVTIDIPAAKAADVFEPAFSLLRQIDEQFSTYKPDSEVSRFARGELKTPSRQLAQVIKDCKKYESETDGYFSAWAGGQFDPSGYVKGWAIKQAGQSIEQQGFKTYCISAGGDILANSNTNKIWKIGIQDPRDPTKLLDLSSISDEKDMPAPHQNLSGAVGNRIAEHQVFGAGLSISNGAVATSGNYERGQHIINPKNKKLATELLSVTISGPDIIKADVLATAIFAMGRPENNFLEAESDYETLVVDITGRIKRSVNFRSRGSSR